MSNAVTYRKCNRSFAAKTSHDIVTLHFAFHKMMGYNFKKCLKWKKMHVGKCIKKAKSKTPGIYE